MAQALEAVSPLLRRMAHLNRYLSQDFLGGPRPFKMAWVINAQEATTLLFVAALMLAYRIGSTVAWVYLALHGTYGLCWLLKHVAFPDRTWEVAGSLPESLRVRVVRLEAQVLRLLLLVPVAVRRGQSEPDFDCLRGIARPERIDEIGRNQVEMPAIGISGTEIRRRVTEGLSIRYRTPPAVEQYILAHGLYREEPFTDNDGHQVVTSTFTS